jgi:hypothetical protein
MPARRAVISLLSFIELIRQNVASRVSGGALPVARSSPPGIMRCVIEAIDWYQQRVAFESDVAVALTA